MPKSENDPRHPLLCWARKNSIPTKVVCEKLGVSRTAIHYWNTGHRSPRAFTLQMILDYTKGGVTANDCHEYWQSLQGKRA